MACDSFVKKTMNHLRPFTRIILFLGLMALMQACPLKVRHPLDVYETHKVDSLLLGDWFNALGEDVGFFGAFSVRAMGEYAYRVHVTDTNDGYVGDQVVFIGWQAELDDHQFVVLETCSRQYMHYKYELAGDTLVLYGMPKPTLELGDISSTSLLRDDFRKLLLLPEMLESPLRFVRAG